MAGPVQEGSDSRVDLHTRENKESNLNSTTVVQKSSCSRVKVEFLFKLESSNGKKNVNVL